MHLSAKTLTRSARTLCLLAAMAIIGLWLAAPPRSVRAETIHVDVAKDIKVQAVMSGFNNGIGPEAVGIIRQDLLLSGYFELNSARPDYEITGSVSGQGIVVVEVFVYKLGPDGKRTEVMGRRFQALPTVVRTLSHHVANSIYEQLTDLPGIFRSRIAYVAEPGGQPSLHIMDWDGERERALGPRSTSILRPHWSWDGQSLLYSAKRGDYWSVFVYSFQSERERELLRAPGTNIAGDYLPGDVRFLMTSSYDLSVWPPVYSTPDIYIYDIDLKRAYRVTDDRSNEVSPSITPDGDLLAYVSDKTGKPNIYTMVFSSKGKKGYTNERLTYSYPYNTSPVWSPRCDMIAYVASIEGRHQIVTARPDGSGVRVLTSAGNNEDPAFSPDGRFIAFSSDRTGVEGIYVMRSDGRDTQRRLTGSKYKAYSPGWSKPEHDVLCSTPRAGR